MTRSLRGWVLAALLIPLVAFVMSACGGMPDEYDEAIGDGNDRPGVSVCATDSTVGPMVASAYMVDNPGDEPIEIEQVTVVETSFDPVDLFVVSLPSEETVGFGAGTLDDPGGGNPALAAAWQGRSAPPATIPPGHHGEILVVVPLPEAPDQVEYVAALEITLVVGDHRRTITHHQINAAGSSEACDALSLRLYPPDES